MEEGIYLSVKEIESFSGDCYETLNILETGTVYVYRGTYEMILHIGDKFNRIVDIMNTCFDRNYKACMRGWYALNKDMNTSAWFPKIADLSGGVPKPGDKWYGWCNTISPDGQFIYMNNFENPQFLDETEIKDKPEVNLTFVRYPGDKQYTYVGVYTLTRRDAILGWVHERIAEDIDSAMYL